MRLQVAGILMGNARQLGRALDSDGIVEPVRGPLIPGFSAVKAAALAAGVSRPLRWTGACTFHALLLGPGRREAMGLGAAGAFGCTISGAGPTCVAVVADAAVGERVADAMVTAFTKEGKLEVNSAHVSRLCQRGARTVGD